ncbi:RNase H family protein [uncultured Lactobacillus sp.]|uniref:RNase H family protein n=1 Tax=uncultured Lactobacillus sp. TaxID=153152 RepID=UPI002804A0AF|nr:RNase H family protein [uncultured Lactobacillus sp.]
MSEKRFLVITVDYRPKMVEGNWFDDIEPQIKEGQIYRGFVHRKDAEEVFAKLNNVEMEPNVEIFQKKIEAKKNDLQKDQIMLFTDGSYKDSEPKRYGAGWGYYGIYNDSGKIKEIHDHSFVPVQSARQVNGEITAVKEALSEASSLGRNKVDLYCDLRDLILWDCGFNQTKKDISQDFVEYMKYCRNERNMEITFHWCPAHKGISYNEKADAEAKAGFEEAPTKEQLYDRLNELQKELSNLRGDVSYYRADNTGSVIGDTGRLTDNQASYDNAVDDYSEYEKAREIEECEETIKIIQKELGINH